MDLDAGTVDEQPVGRIIGAGQRAEDAFPYAPLGPADEPVVECFLRPVEVRAVRPATATSEGMDDPAQNTAIIHPFHATNVGRQKRLDPSPLRIRKPKEISHFIASSQEAMNHEQLAVGIPLMGPNPKYRL
jgi:hypothetical protein